MRTFNVNQNMWHLLILVTNKSRLK